MSLIEATLTVLPLREVSKAQRSVLAVNMPGELLRTMAISSPEEKPSSRKSDHSLYLIVNIFLFVGFEATTNDF